MRIILYKTSSETNEVDKVLTSGKDYSDCTVRGEIEVISPTIVITTMDNLSQYNYARIEIFGRYYFVVSVEATRTGVWTLSLKVDVLMSYKEQIRQEIGVIERQETEANLYIADPEFKMQERTQVVTKEFAQGFGDVASIMLVTCGRGLNPA